jgi:hypothetical protein
MRKRTLEAIFESYAHPFSVPSVVMDSRGRVEHNHTSL